jgi:two-component system, NtrC family, sensor kinase
MSWLPRSSSRRGIARRLGWSFLLLFAILGTATYFGLASLLELHAALHDVEGAAGRQGAVLRLASAVRDQYAHMAHTLILGDETHTTFYRQASGLVRATVKTANRADISSAEHSLLEQVRHASAELDAIFAGSLLPAIRRADREAAVDIHEGILDVVSRAQTNAQELSDISAQAIARVGAHAEVVEHKAIQLTLGFLGAAIVFALGMAVYLHRSLTIPIQRLSEGTAQLAEGNLKVKLAVTGRDELADLAHRFNSMTDALSEHQRRLVQSETLAGLGRMAAGFAHEINNPLGVIIGYVSLIRRKAEGAIAQDLAVVEQEARRCHEIVEDLLDLTRSPAPERETIDLRVLAQDVATRLTASSPVSASPIAVEGNGSVTGSSRRVRQIVQNLVKNAMEATADLAGEVRIAIRNAPAGSVTFSVTDNGPGIAPEQRRLVFEPFFTTKTRGTGLGLAVSKAIARAQGGDLELADADGPGATFRLVLPAAGEEP